MTQLTDNVFAVKVPDGSKKHHIGCTLKTATSPDQSIFYKHKDDDELEEWKFIDLPPGSYEFLFCTKSATEEDARKVVKPVNNPFLKGSNIYRDYSRPQTNTVADATLPAIESLNSLLRSKNLSYKKNYALIQKLK